MRRAAGLEKKARHRVLLIEKGPLRPVLKGMISTIRQTETKGSNATRPLSVSATARMHSHRGRTMYNIAWYAPEHKKKQNQNARKNERGKVSC